MAYQTTLIERGTWRSDTADCFADVLAKVEKSISPWPHETRASRENGRHEWFGTRSFADAVRIAKNGWPEGRAKLLSNLDAAKFLQTNATIRAESLDVAGSFPLVPAAVAGDPLNMFTIGLERAKTRPIFRFIVSMSVSGGVSAEVITNRGAAILSWVDRLENEGARCEVVFTMAAEKSYGSGRLKKWSLSFVAKRADEPLELDRMAFIIAHPSMLRRICFACYELHEDMKHFAVSYGTPSDAIADAVKVPHTVYFGKLAYGGEWTTIETAVAGVAAAIAKMQTQEDLDLEDAA